MLHTETVEKGTLDLIKKISGDEKLKDFTLAGGTALALQLGHRISVDIDLFSKHLFDPLQVADHIKRNYPGAQVLAQEEGFTVGGYINQVKATFVAHQYPDVNPPLTIEGIRMASLDDIAAMKVNAIYYTGERYKDFVDIYNLLEHRSLNQILESAGKKYPDIDLNMAKKALQNPSSIDLNAGHVEEIGRHVYWPEIKGRIKNSVDEPNKIFVLRHRRQVKGGPHQRLRRKRGPGL